MARILLLIACGPCEPLVGWYDGTISGDVDGNVEVEVVAVDETTIEITGFWSPVGLARTGDPNFTATRTCAEHDTVSTVEYAETWEDLTRGGWERWIGSATFKFDRQGMTGGYFFDIETGPTEADLVAQEQIAGTWEAIP